MSFTLELDVAAAPAEVFRFVADFTTMPEWYSAVQRVERVEGTGDRSTEYAVYRQLPTGPAVNHVAVTSYTEGREITFTSVSGPTPFTYRYQVLAAPGGTRLRLDGTISAVGLPAPARLLGPMVERIFQRGMRDNLGALREKLQHRS